MLETYGNIWDLAKDYEAVVITTNGFVKKNGEAVMGRGIAKEVVERFPDFPEALGNMITKFGNNVFGFKFDNDPDHWYVTMPVKPIVGPNGEPGWRAKAQLDIIESSAHQIAGSGDFYGVLRNIEENEKRTITKVLMPRPGCGNGKLTWEEVKPIIEPILDDRFTVVTWHP